LQLKLVFGFQRDEIFLLLEMRLAALEVETRADLAVRLIHRIANLLRIDLRNHIE